MDISRKKYGQNDGLTFLIKYTIINKNTLIKVKNENETSVLSNKI